MICSKCNTDKPTSEFHVDRTKSTGFYPSCKPCRKLALPTYNIDQSRVRASAKRHYYKNVKRSREKRLEYYYRSHETNKKRQRDYLRRDQLRAIKILGGKCAKCGFADTRALQIDHIKAIGGQQRSKEGYAAAKRRVLAGDIRGLQCLCANCNTIKKWTDGEGIKL